MKFRAIIILFLIGVFSAAGSPAQSSATLPLSVSATYGQNPEDAYLSVNRYTNVYFGFSFEFPEDLHLRPMPEAASQDRRIQLLDLSGQAAPHSSISIGAYEYKNKNYSDAKTLLHRQLDQEIFGGVEQVHGIGKTTVGDRSFYYYEARHGVDQHILLAAEMSGYVLMVDLEARDPKLLHDLLGNFSHAEFFPSKDATAHAGANATPYQGPAISAEHLQQVRDSAPAERIDAGKITGHMYRNAEIGLSFEFPIGWNIEPMGAIEPAIERYREKALGEPLLGPRERAVVKLCRKTLLSVWHTKPDAGGDVPYDEFGEITLSAMPLSCFPNVRFPDDIKDPRAIREFVIGLNYTQPLQRDMTDARAYEADGKSFVMTHGTIAYKEPGDGLSRRVSVSIAMTQQRGYLLMWLFAAPHESELRQLMASKFSFDTDAKPAQATATQQPAAAPQQTEEKPAATTPAPAAADTGQQPAEAVPQAPSHPSLLRAGEQALSPAPGQKSAPKNPN